MDLRIRGGIGKVLWEFTEAVESHQPIVDALEKGREREAGLLLRNHVETVLEWLKRAKSDPAFHRSIRSDLEKARDVQKSFFPKGDISIPGLSCDMLYKPAQSIGCDYYDFFPLRADRWGIAIGDVCGKGIGAALLMAGLQGALRAQARHGYTDLAALIADLDRLILAASPKDLYASLFYAEYEVGPRMLRYVNAGHDTPIVLRGKGGHCEMFHLKSNAPPLGLLESSQFSSREFQLERGDVLVAYTDGITEAETLDDELWGMKGLENLLRSCRDRSPVQIIKRILDEITSLANGRLQRDDQTLVVIEVEDGP